MVDDEVKVGTEVLAIHQCAEENTCNSTSCGTMNSAEIEEGKNVDHIRVKQSPFGVSGKRKKDCKSESFDGSPLQITRKRSELGKNLDERCKELGDGIKKSPVQIKKTRLVSSQKGTGDQTRVGNEISSVQLRKVKSDSAKALKESKSELRKMNSEPSKNLDIPSDGNLKNSLQLVKAKTPVPRKIIDESTNKSGEEKVVDDSKKDLGEPVGRIEESAVGIKNSKSQEECKELKAIQIVTTPPNVDGEEEEEEEVDKEIEVEKKNLDIKDIDISVEDQKLKKLVVKEKKLHPRYERSVPILPIIKMQIPAAKIYPKPDPDNPHGTPSKLQSLADLIMWRDISRSAFVFGIGAFAIISSSYTKDLQISFISVLSYLGLVYLGVSFIFKSLISRGSMDMDSINPEYVVGEEEAIWLVKLFLPYLNEFLVKLRSLFSGDPPTTMKLAVLLFIMARCGGSITIWKMTKLGFFGVFMVPKFCSSYSSHLAAHGLFWLRRFGDVWERCSHKKAVGFGMFTLVWNQSSVIARIWGVFLLLVAFKCYQHCYFWIKQDDIDDSTHNSNSNDNKTKSSSQGV